MDESGNATNAKGALTTDCDVYLLTMQRRAATSPL
jgi:hypothetical protein